MSIAEEHLATSISLRVISLQREAFRAARRRATQRVLLAGAQGEQHVGGRGIDPSWAAAFDVVLCPHVTEVVHQVDALVHRARSN